MKIEKLMISELVAPERNIRLHGSSQLKEFERSVRMFGQIRPVVIDDDNVILCGNGLYETMKQMGLKEIDAYRVSGLTENQKKKLMIADNKIYSLGVDDLNVFDEFINELKDELDIPGFDDETLKALVADADEITDKIAEYGTIDDDEIAAIKASGRAKEKIIQESDTEMSKSSPTAPADTQAIKEPVETDKAPERPFEGPRAETQSKYVICPKCGEKIWL